MTSTEQFAVAATAADTLPSRKRLIRLNPLAPTNMQSAPHLFAIDQDLFRVAGYDQMGSCEFVTAELLLEGFNHLKCELNGRAIFLLNPMNYFRNEEARHRGCNCVVDRDEANLASSRPLSARGRPSSFCCTV